MAETASLDFNNIPGYTTIGTMFGTVLYGIEVAQMYYYTCNYTKDPIWLKILVALLWITDTFKEISCIVIEQIVDYVESGTVQWYAEEFFCIALPLTYLQSYYIYIIWTIYFNAFLAILNAHHYINEAGEPVSILVSSFIVRWSPSPRSVDASTGASLPHCSMEMPTMVYEHRSSYTAKDMGSMLEYLEDEDKIKIEARCRRPREHSAMSETTRLNFNNSLGFYGIAVAQMCYYVSKYIKDPLWLKLLVHFLLKVLEASSDSHENLVLNTKQTLWFILVRHHADLVALLEVPTYYIYIIWKLGPRTWWNRLCCISAMLPKQAIMAEATLGHLSSRICPTLMEVYFKSHRYDASASVDLFRLTITTNVITLVTDLYITISLCFVFQRARIPTERSILESDAARSEGILSKLVKYTANRGLIFCLQQAVMLGTYIWDYKTGVQVTEVFSFSRGACYLNAFLAVQSQISCFSWADGTEPEPCATLGTSGQTELKISAVETLKRLCMNGDVGDSSCRVESARGVKRWSSGGSDAMFLEPFRITAAMIFPVREISDVCLVTLVADGISLDVELTAVGREDVEGIEIGDEMLVIDELPDEELELVTLVVELVLDKINCGGVDDSFGSTEFVETEMGEMDEREVGRCVAESVLSGCKLEVLLEILVLSDVAFSEEAELTEVVLGVEEVADVELDEIKARESDEVLCAELVSDVVTADVVDGQTTTVVFVTMTVVTASSSWFSSVRLIASVALRPSSSLAFASVPNRRVASLEALSVLHNDFGQLLDESAETVHERMTKETQVSRLVVEGWRVGNGSQLPLAWSEMDG
ncbi:predicted protein [Postia placenta Mad-698-R]|nr:predicted protein [Postia placenta Mad-698-R]